MPLRCLPPVLTEGLPLHRPVVVVLSAVLALVGCSGGDDPTIDTSGSPVEGAGEATSTTEDTATDAALAAEVTATEGAQPTGTVQLSAGLSGSAEVPGPGDDGSGSFVGTLMIEESAGELCYELEVTDLSMAPAAAHVHRGGEDEAGEVVIELAAPSDGRSEECVAVPAGDAAPLFEAPSSFYVNVHTDDYPDGAVRGQLVRDG